MNIFAYVQNRRVIGSFRDTREDSKIDATESCGRTILTQTQKSQKPVALVLKSIGYFL